MIRSFPKKGRLKLEGIEYLRFKNAVHEADRWRCRICQFFGRSGLRPLSVHHLVKRSTLRLDVVHNGVSACHTCHDSVESHHIDVRWIDADKRILEVVVIREDRIEK